MCIRNVKKAGIEKCLMALPEISVLVSETSLHCISQNNFSKRLSTKDLFKDLR